MPSAPFADATLWYCPPGFDAMGLAIPNWGQNDRTLNGEILEVTELVGKSTQAVMLSPDAMVTSPPRQNIVNAIAAMCERAFQLVTSHMTPEGQGVSPIDPHHAQDWQPFRVYPTPYANVKNQTLKKFATLALNAQTELMKSGDNALPLFLSQATAGQVLQYLHLIYQRLATDWLNVPIQPMVNDANGVPQFQPTDPRSLAFRLTLAQKAAYAPSTVFTPIEQTAVAPSPADVPTEIDLLPITSGIAVPQLPLATGVKQFPSIAQGPSSSGAAQPAINGPVTALPAAPGSLAAQSAATQAVAAGAGSSAAGNPQ